MVQHHLRSNLKRIERLLLAQKQFHSAPRYERGSYYWMSVSRAYVQLMMEDQDKLQASTFSCRCSRGNHLVRFFRNKLLSELRPRHVEAYVQSRLAEGARWSTVSSELSMIAKLLRRALNRRRRSDGWYRIYSTDPYSSCESASD
jgi:hypothetical protein